MLRMMFAILGLTMFATTAHARHHEDRMLERLTCVGEIDRDGDLELRVTTYFRDCDGDMDRDYDVIRCRHDGMTRSGTHMFSCNNPYLVAARISPNLRGIADLNIHYGNVSRSFRSSSRGCAIGGYLPSRERDYDVSEPEKGVDQGAEQGPEQGEKQGPEQDEKQGPEQGKGAPLH